jgi:hypothetical protein
MALEQRKKVAYLFGAGATHAELINLDQTCFGRNNGS